MTRVELRSVDFRRERQGTWRELERIVARIERHGLRLVSARDVNRLPVLYRATISSLSVARAISLDQNLIEYLESLCARAYCCVYGARGGLWESIVSFFTKAWPEAVRRLRTYVIVASVTLLVGISVGAKLVSADSEKYYAFVPEDMAAGRTPAASTEFLRDNLYETHHGVLDALSLFAAQLFTHNSQVAILCFVAGIAGCVPTLALLFVNGLILGAFLALHAERGLVVDLLGWILPHGITEIFAVILAAAAGLSLGQALLFPGRSTRLENLARAGRTGAAVVLGAVVMLLIAGLIEGFFRQVVTDVVARYALALCTIVAWYIYFVPRRRDSEPH